MASTKWDAIVIGAGIAGLGAGALLANAGKKVLVLERGNQFGGRATSVTHDGHKLDNGIHGISLNGFLEDIFKRLELEFPGVHLNAGSLQYHDVKDGKFHSIEFPSDVMRRIMKEEILGKTYEELATLYDVPLSSWVATKTDNDMIHKWFALQGMMITPTDQYSKVSAGDLLIRIKEIIDRHGSLRGAIGFVKEGLIAITKPMADYVTSHGGEIRTSTRVTEIVIENSEAVGVVIEKGKRLFPAHVMDSERIDASAVISTLPMWDIFRVIPEDDLPRYYVDWVKSIHKKVVYVWGFMAGSSEPVLPDESFWGWVPNLRHTGKLSALGMIMGQQQYAKPGEYQVSFQVQTTHELMPDFVDGDREAKNQKELHRIFELLEQDFREFFPDWEKKCL